MVKKIKIAAMVGIAAAMCGCILTVSDIKGNLFGAEKENTVKESSDLNNTISKDVQAATQKVMAKKITPVEKMVVYRVGEKKKIKVKVSPTAAQKEKLVYTAGKKGKSPYLSVDAKGRITAKKKSAVGKTVYVHVYVKNNRKVKCSVRVKILPKIDPKKKMIALTFDDGVRLSPNRRIRHVFEKANGAATFFVLGSSLGAKENRAEVKKMYYSGMEIASHTQNHLQLTRISSTKLNSEVRQADHAIKKVIGKKPRLVRTPYGAYNSTVLKALHRPMVIWSIDTLDWKTRNSVSTYNTVMRQARDGSIVLMHSIYDPTASAVEKIVPALQKKGYQLVTVSEMYRYKGIKMKHGKVYNGIHK